MEVTPRRIECVSSAPYGSIESGPYEEILNSNECMICVNVSPPLHRLRYVDSVLVRVISTFAYLGR